MTTLGSLIGGLPTPPEDRVIYERGGVQFVYVTKTGAAITNAPLPTQINVLRPNGNWGEWVPKAPTPIPTPTPPALPVLTRKIAGPDPRGHGIYITKGPAVTLTDTHVEGFETNLSFEHIPALTLKNVRTVKAWRGKPADSFIGQGIYADDITGPVNVSEFYSRWNGWQPGKPASEKTTFRHGAYHNFAASSPNIDTAIFADNCSCGFQSRNGAVIRNAVFLGNTNAIIAVMGGFTLEDCTIFGGSYQATVDAQGKLAWTGNVGLMNYWPVKMKGVWIIGRVGQTVPVLTPTAKAYNLGAILTGGKYPKPNEWKPPSAGPLITATDCRIAGWPGPSFAGPRPHDGSGFVVTPTPVDYDPEPILKAVEANTMSIGAGVQRLHAEIRGRVQ